jgi:hypothetical protein
VSADAFSDAAVRLEKKVERHESEVQALKTGQRCLQLDLLASVSQLHTKLATEKTVADGRHELVMRALDDIKTLLQRMVSNGHV